MQTWLNVAARALLEVVLPVRCIRCGATCAEETPAVVPAGLRWCDSDLLCGTCREDLLAPLPTSTTLTRNGETLTAAAGRPTDAALVEIVAAWKYRGCRGLALSLAELADAGWDSAVAAGGAVDALVPIPLHPRRRRERGFNQAALLAGLLAADRGVPVIDDLLVRRRATAQQAKLSSQSNHRDRNVTGAFGLARRDTARGLRVGLVDDLVTSGATALAATACLRGAGVRVGWVLAAGLARHA